MNYRIVQRNTDTWSIEDGMVRFFLLTGEKNALLIDSGHSVTNAKEIAQKITDLPLLLLNTHADPDHIGSNGEFDSFYMNLAEAGNYYKEHQGKGTILPIENGDILDLGNRPLKIISVPGHTPGSVAILDMNSGILFSGDTVQDSNIFMFGARREMHAFIQSLEKLERMQDAFLEIYPSHGSLPLKPMVIGQIREGAQRVLCGAAQSTPVNMFGQEVELYHMDCCGILYDGERKLWN